MKIPTFTAYGDYHADAAQLGLVEPTPAQQDSPPYFDDPASPNSAAWSNVFESQPLTRKWLQTGVRRTMPLGMLLRSLRQEAVLLSVAALRYPGVRVHPRNAVLAALTSTSCQLKDIVESLRRPQRVVDKWLQRLCREGIVGYRRDVGWHLL